MKLETTSDELSLPEDLRRVSRKVIYYVRTLLTLKRYIYIYIFILLKDCDSIYRYPEYFRPRAL